jgi:hypothetical protein
MKHFAIFCFGALLCVGVCGSVRADDAEPTKPAPRAGRKPPSKTSASTKTAKPAPPAAPAATPAAPAKDTEIPPDAIKINDSTWQKADSQGRLWNYSKTPFGVSKTDANAPAAAAPAPVSAAAGFTAVEQGDSVHFERDTPFGRQKWTKKKTDMTDDERAIWLRQSGQKQDPPKSQE